MTTKRNTLELISKWIFQNTKMPYLVSFDRYKHSRKLQKDSSLNMRLLPEKQNVITQYSNKYIGEKSSKQNIYCHQPFQEDRCYSNCAKAFPQRMAPTRCRKLRRDAKVLPTTKAGSSATALCYNLQKATFPSVEMRTLQVGEQYTKSPKLYTSPIILKPSSTSPKTYASVLKTERKEEDTGDSVEKQRTAVHSIDVKRESPLDTKCQKLLAGTFKIFVPNNSDFVTESERSPKRGTNSKTNNKFDDLRKLFHNATSVHIQKSPTEISPINGTVINETSRSRTNSIELSKEAATCLVIPQATVCGSSTTESLLNNDYITSSRPEIFCNNSAIACIMGIGLSYLDSDDDDDSSWDNMENEVVSDSDGDDRKSLENYIQDKPSHCSEDKTVVVVCSTDASVVPTSQPSTPLATKSKIPKDVADGAEFRNLRQDLGLDGLLKEANIKWNEFYGDVSPSVKPTKVTFPEGSKLHKVNSVESFCRKGEWEQYARDRERFQKRILDVGLVISPVLRNEFRTKIFNTRVASSLYLSQNTSDEPRTDS